MSIQFNMANAQELGQEGFLRDVPNQDESGGDCKKIRKQSLLAQPSYPSEFQIPTDKKILKEKKRAFEFKIPTDKKIMKEKKRTRRNDKNHDEELPDHEIHIWTERERRKKMRDMFSKLHALLPQLPPKADKSTIVDEAVSFIKSLEHKIQKLHAQKLEKLRYSSSSNITPTITYDPSSSSSPSTLLTPISNHSQILPVGADSYHREAFMADQISSSNATTLNLPYPCNDPIAVFDTWSSPNVVLSIYGNEASFSFCFPKDKSGVLTTVCYFFEKYNIEVLSATISTNVFRRNYMFQAQIIPSCQAQVMADGYGVGEIFKQVAQELVSYYSSP